MDIEVKELNDGQEKIFFELFEKLVKTQFPEYSPAIRNFMVTSDNAWNEKVFKERFKKHNRYFLGAFINGELIGILEATLPEFGISFTSWLMVDPKAQKKGVGRKLLETWEKDMKAKGVHALYLNADERNRSFYEKTGFMYMGVFKKAWFGLDSLYFVKKIAEAKEENYLK